MAQKLVVLSLKPERNLTGHCYPSVKISAACVLSHGPRAQVDLCFGGHHPACLGILTGRQTLWEYVTVLSLKVLFVLFSPTLRKYIYANAHAQARIHLVLRHMLSFSDVSLYLSERNPKEAPFTIQLALISFRMKVWKVWKGSVWYLTIRGECITPWMLSPPFCFSLLSNENKITQRPAIGR